MLLGDGFAHAMVPKCAGTFALRWYELAKLGFVVGQDRPDWMHLGVIDVTPDVIGDRKLIVPIRNPWDRAVSWFYFTRGKHPSEDLEFHPWFAEGTDREFCSVMRRIAFPEETGDLDTLFSWPSNVARGFPVKRIMARLGIGLLTYQYLRIALDDMSVLIDGSRDDLVAEHERLCERAAVFDCADLRVELPKILAECGVEITDMHRESIENLPKVNAAATDSSRSQRQRPIGPPSVHFDDESIEWIREREWLLVEKFGFEGPSS